MKRFLEIDALRGIALCMMVLYHLVFDLHFFSILPGRLPPFEWIAFGRISAFLFVFLAGLSLHLSISRAKLSGAPAFSKYFKRGARIFLLGLLITFATWIFPHEGFIIFGALHLIGIAIIIGYFLERFYLLNLILGALILILGLWSGAQATESPLLFLLGFPIAGLLTLDYFPLAPWFGVFLLGMFFGKALYPVCKRKCENLRVEGKIACFLGFLGQKTLIIYFLHQPIILLLLWLLGFF